MPKVTVFNQSGSQVGDVELAEAVFGITPNENVVHDAVVMQQASLRQGTQKAKTRSEVRGGGAKPWRQKGTGRARHGSSRSPIWKGGGVIFAPTPRSYSYKLPKKVRRLALKSVLSDKVQNDALIVLDELSLDAPKTKDMINILSSLSAEKTLVVTAERNANVEKSANNLPNVKTITATGVNVLDVINYDKVIITKEAVERVEEVLS
ncbi:MULTISPECIES: 50S ribosomal protein L4 [Geomicrobium]|uniref:Large ribosomal subunit protein uL4 n=1 Tax=Geomicrobium sediminis TaxID=1347788 RepID=A0ABS2PHA5_9BACL|nr:MULTISPECIES: 50S ribosomal protein L4 [Geomicrobium]EZH64460.1 50S ribosomal protein L4 [Bacillaceae bacterium JMAK1]MBM7634667.1 large subunit ribosomal protein L4 [Geomicrobium sediminis]GAK01061.1 LSU ribosomal protein L4p [Geomicrobium sp. JCM 19055]